MKASQKTEVIGTKSFDSMLWDRIAKESQVETPPVGSISCATFAKKYNFTVSKATSILETRVQRGELQVKKFRQTTTHGARSIKFYWEAGK